MPIAENNITQAPAASEWGENNLFPVFLKLDELNVLLVGGGNVGLEKLQALISNAPAAHITIVATTVSDVIKNLATSFSTIQIMEKPFEETDLSGKDMVVVAVNNKETSLYISRLSKEKKIWVNVADTPDQCDFYLGSIVKKGNLKIAISTNGKSPTIAKRLKEVINDMIPDEVDHLLKNMQTIRNGIDGDFSEKVKRLNDITAMLVAKQLTLEDSKLPEQKKWQQVVIWCLLAFCFMILGHALLSYVPFEKIIASVQSIPDYIDGKMFGIMLLTGFLAQMVDGSLGMGYGTISTTMLLAVGVNPAIVSSRVHSARVFSSGVSGYVHHRFGNINKKLYKTLVIPGILGAIIGASLAFFGQKYSSWVRLPLCFYTLYLGYFIVRKAFGKKDYQTKVKRAGWLAATGGFLDAFAGGGWGTLVTSTLISKRKSPRYVIGSVCLAEFFVVLTSSITFFILLKSIPLLDVAGLILGGLIAAPIAARLVGRLPLKTMFISVGTLVILTSLLTLWKVLSGMMHG